MARYSIGVTERGDAGLDLSWKDKLDTVDGAIVITKRISKPFFNAVIHDRNKLIVHATVTGYGGTLLEPYVPPLEYSLEAVQKLVDAGFPKKKIVIRVDPTIPTSHGMTVAFSVIKKFIDIGFSRYRISLIDMYPHVLENFRSNHIESPYGNNFGPDSMVTKLVDMQITSIEDYWNSLHKSEWLTNKLRIECCAEPKLKQVIHCGCVSEYDLRLLGLTEDRNVNSLGYQRPDCMCYSGKTELLNRKSKCGHQCLYCYWK